MNILINKTSLKIFEGARVADAIRLYYRQHKKAIPKPLPSVYDIHGNHVNHDGSLHENIHLYLK